ncbi:unnamed protein product [Gongylonema pulchrum]|uniref:Secreted protein n=1 Tax=Gongylonema pulchrum TaxID=637853 RepID=A0A183EXX4_9BILA|nr:unnamed protein product [Gongylonema pulchrum]
MWLDASRLVPVLASVAGCAGPSSRRVPTFVLWRSYICSVLVSLLLLCRKHIFGALLPLLFQLFTLTTSLAMDESDSGEHKEPGDSAGAGCNSMMRDPSQFLKLRPKKSILKVMLFPFLLFKRKTAWFFYGISLYS